MIEKIPSLIASKDKFITAKSDILSLWTNYDEPKEILKLHEIDRDFFIQKYASGVFDYFIGIIDGSRELGNCPIMQELLAYFKYREISADELFDICSHFRRAMIEYSYNLDINSKKLFQEISYIFDKNFKGILKFYTDTIFEKLIDARQEALQAGQAKEYFLSNMSHEIRTPLNAILGFVYLLSDEELTKKQRNYLDIILSSGENLLSIINDILDFSKLRSGEFTVDPKLFSLHEELSHTMELFVASATSKDITITSFIDPMIPKELYADALRIKQILSNFLSNAIKFTPDNGVISITSTCHDGLLKISIKDNGIGISQEDIKHIFTAFAQAQYTQVSNCDGTGLGLSICHQLSELMGGKVYVNSEVGEGSTFWMEIPVEIENYQCLIFEDIEDFQTLKMVIYIPDLQVKYQHDSFIKYANIFNMDLDIVNSLESDFDVAIFVHEEINDEIKEKIKDTNKQFIVLMSKQYDDYDVYTHINSMCFPLYCSKIHTAFSELVKPEAFSPRHKQKAQKFVGHVLVAEDNEANQELIKILLMKYGLSFDIANNGLEAFELYQNNRYDLILMDEQMPVMDGNESIKKILEYENINGLRHIPVSALTANVIKGARERGLLSGFDSFLGKPIVIKELERVFISYLKIASTDTTEIVQESSNKATVEGLDTKKLREELMLNDDELIMLLDMFIKKMTKVLPDLLNSIKQKDYEKIALNAHSIKGSSGNFRIEMLQNSASEMEQMAKEKNSSYNYVEVYESIKEKVLSIKIL